MKTSTVDIRVKQLTLLLFLPFLFVQCYNKYLQKGVLYSPIPDDPIIVSKDREAGDLTVSIDINYSVEDIFKANNGKHSKVNEYGIVQFDTIIDPTWINGRHYADTLLIFSDKNKYDFEGQNITWNLPPVSLGLSLEYDLSESFFILSSFDWSYVDGENLYRFIFGLGGASENDAVGFQTHLKVGIQKLKHIVEILHGYDDYWAVKVEEEYAQELCLHINASINTIKEWLYLNYLLSIGITQFKYLDTEFSGVNSYIHYLLVTPGLFKDFGRNRILAGCKLAVPINLIGNQSLTNKSKYVLPKIFLQYNFTISTIKRKHIDHF